MVQTNRQKQYQNVATLKDLPYMTRPSKMKISWQQVKQYTSHVTLWGRHNSSKGYLLYKYAGNINHQRNPFKKRFCSKIFLQGVGSNYLQFMKGLIIIALETYLSVNIKLQAWRKSSGSVKRKQYLPYCCITNFVTNLLFNWSLVSRISPKHYCSDVIKLTSSFLHSNAENSS